MGDDTGSALLLYRDASGGERSCPLTRGRPVTIGRGQGVDLSLPWDRSVSSIHAEAVPLGDHWLISDEGISRNGTFVNDERIAGRRRLRHGDAIRVGRTVLSFIDPSGRRGATTHADHMQSMGIVTVLFTDVVGSTELMDRLGDDAVDQLQREHFESAQAIAGAHGGRMVKTLGDGVMLAFPSALEAIASAAELQRSSTAAGGRGGGAGAIALRVGLNAGEAISVEDDYFGTPVVVAKRLCDLAAPGQTLVAAVVPSLVGSRGGFRFRSVGPLALKGIAEPVDAFELLPSPE